MKTSILVGGQAVIEGVMMRVPGAYATAVKKNTGEIVLDYHSFNSLTTQHKIFNFPIIRGMIHLYESMKIGYQTLQWSADIAEPNEKTNKILDSILSFFSILFAIGLFFGIPIFLAEILQNYIFSNQNLFTFNLLSGLIRIILFLTYLFLISFLQDVKRLFQFHGAEHKTVYNFESGKDINPKNASKFPKEHPRCGTSFVFIVMLVAIISFTIIDTVLTNMGVDLTVLKRLLIHIPCIPIVAGFSYEVLKIIAKFQKYLFFQILAFPGLMLQKITTHTPNEEQLEVAISALSHAFGDNLSNFKGKKFNADAIG